MGKLYTKYTLEGENILATFENGTVYSPIGALGMGHETLMFYDGNKIYRSVSFSDFLPNVLARCDKFGRIESRDGKRLGYCENGEVKDSSGSIVAYYEGDMFGAAAAACAVIFHLSDTTNSSRTNSNDADSSRSDSSNKPSAGSSADTNDFSVASVIFSILGAVFIAIWKFIKTIPFWGPYGSILLLPTLMYAGPGGSSSGGGTTDAVGLFSLVYFILHTILLFKCKKWQAKHRYWPIYTEFFILVIGALLGGASFLVISSIPTVAFQIGVLIYMKREPQNNSPLLCQSCGRQIKINAKYCPSCGKPAQNAKEENVTISESETLSKQKDRKKIPLFVILPVIVILLLSIVHIVQYSGYKSFVKEYFETMEAGDMDEITQFYSWDYVEEKNKENMSKPYTQFFIYDNLEHYIESTDKYYRWFAGEEIEKIKISQTEKNMLSSTPQIEVKVFVVFENQAKDVIVFIDMERGNDGWYVTGTDAYYASDEVAD